MKILFIVCFQILSFLGKSENDTVCVKLEFRLCNNQKNIIVPVFDEEWQTFSFELYGDTLICNILPIIKEVKNGTYEDCIRTILSKKNKTFAQILPIPIFLEATKNDFKIIILKYKNDVFIFERDKTDMYLFKAICYRQITRLKSKKC